MLKRMKNRKGFTLIELLIVVAIIGIIAAIAVPTLLSTRGAALDNKAQGTLRNVHSAQSAYYARHGEYTDWATLVTDGFLDARFAASPFTEEGVVYTDVSAGAGQTFEANATLPANLGGTSYTIKEDGYIVSP